MPEPGRPFRIRGLDGGVGAVSPLAMAPAQTVLGSRGSCVRYLSSVVSACPKHWKGPTGLRGEPVCFATGPGTLCCLVLLTCIDSTAPDVFVDSQGQEASLYACQVSQPKSRNISCVECTQPLNKLGLSFGKEVGLTFCEGLSAKHSACGDSEFSTCPAGELGWGVVPLVLERKTSRL